MIKIGTNGVYNYWVDWTENSQNVANNSTNVSVYLRLKRNDGYAGSAYNNYNNNTIQLSVGGTERVKITNANIDTRNGKIVTLASWTGDVTHGTDGALKLSISGSFLFNSTAVGSLPYGTYSISTAAELTKIPRASSFSSVTPTVEVNGTSKCYVYVNRQSTSFYHKVRWSIGNYNYTSGAFAAETSYAFPMSWLNAITDSMEGTCTVTLYTYEDSSCANEIGSVVNTEIKLTVPASVKPTLVVNVSAASANTVVAGWGIALQGYSYANLYGTVAAAYGAGIKSYRLSGGGYSGTSASLTTGILNSSGLIPFSYAVTDARGQPAEKTVYLTVEAYHIPYLSNALLYRCDASGTASDTGAYIYAKATANYASCAGKNSIKSLKVYWRKSGSSSWSSADLTSGTGKVVGSSGIDTKYIYEAYIEATDALGKTGRYTESIPSEHVFIHKKKGGKALGIGKYVEKDELVDSAWPIKAPGLTITGDIAGMRYDWVQTLTVGSDTRLFHVDLGSTISSFLLSVMYTVANVSVSDIYAISIGYGKVNITKIADNGFGVANKRTIKAWCQNNAFSGGIDFTLNASLYTGYTTAPVYCKFIPMNSGLYFNSRTSGEIGPAYPDFFSVFAELVTENQQNFIATGSTKSPTVINTGTSGIWTYRKWSDGTYECWGKSAKNCSVTIEWGGMYHAGEAGMFQEAYPVTFLEGPTVQYTMHATASVFALAWGWGNELTHTPKVTPMRPKDPGTFTVYVYWYVKGKVAT